MTHDEKKIHTVFISGASRGIGKAIAYHFARHGCHLVLTCQSSYQELLDFAGFLEDTYHIRCITRQGDIGNENDIKSIFQNLPEIDILINNAGIDYVGLLSEMQLSTWNQVLATNLTSAFLCCREVIPSMIKNKRGKIINISSIWGESGASMEVAYSASKAGLNGLTKSLAKELAPSNIQVNAVACGLIDTKMNACFSDEEISELVSSIPANRIGTPEEVAAFVYSLSFDHTYLTGQIIKIDGGWI